MKHFMKVFEHESIDAVKVWKRSGDDAWLFDSIFLRF